MQSETIPYALFSLQGPNQTGIVAQVTRLLYERDMNIMDSSMTTLRSEFAMMLVLELPADFNQGAFEQDCQGLAQQGLSCSLSPLSAESARHSSAEMVPNYSLSVLGRDRTGIIYRFSELLAAFAVNITDVNTRLMDAQSPPLYAMILELHLPADVDLPALRKQIETVAADLEVDAHFHALESLEI